MIEYLKLSAQVTHKDSELFSSRNVEILRWKEQVASKERLPKSSTFPGLHKKGQNPAAREPQVDKENLPQKRTLTQNSENHGANILAQIVVSQELQAKQQVGNCSICGHLSAEPICDICAHPSRDNTVICVVADSRDLIALEKTREYRGKYHVLGGLISPMDGITPDHLHIQGLVRRVSGGQVAEVIMAIAPSVEGETTTLYVGGLLKPFTKVTRIAFGIPMGGDLEYADEVTLAKAIEGRRELSF